MKTLNAPEAADFLKINHATLCARARAGKIPGTKIGRGWVFIEEDLVQYVRTKYRKKLDDEGTTWGSTSVKAAPSGGSASSSEAQKLERALAPAPGEPRR